MESRLVPTIPYGCVCYQVSGSGLGAGRAACVAGVVCLGEIRKRKTEAPVDGSLTVFLKTSAPLCVISSGRELWGVFLEFAAPSSAQRCFILKSKKTQVKYKWTQVGFHLTMWSSEISYTHELRK